MASPFTTPMPGPWHSDDCACTPGTHASRCPSPVAERVVPATEGQIMRALVPMLDDRNWADSDKAAYVERAAVLKLIIHWAINPLAETTPDKVREVMGGLGELEYGERVNAILAHFAEITDASTHGGACPVEKLYAPLTKAGASALIGWLSEQGQKPGLRLGDTPSASMIADRRAATVEGGDFADSVPAGRYAIDTGVHAVNGTAFYKVDRPAEGKWAGRVFVKQIIGDDEQRLSQKQGFVILAKIAEAGAEVASARYGHEIGECGICGRTLTNDESRERGIGPVCAAKAGW